MAESLSSHPTPRELSCAISTNSNNNYPSDIISTSAIYEIDPPEMTVSRPMSRGSMTSNISLTATKDGVEGNTPKRLGIPPYSLNLLNSMTHSKIRKINSNSNSNCNSNINFNNDNNSSSNGSHLMVKSASNNSIISKNLTADDIINDTRSVTSTPGYPDIPNAPPMSLREKMKLLNVDRNIPMVHDSTDSLDDTLIYQSNDSISITIDNVLGYSYGNKHKFLINNNPTADTTNNNINSFYSIENDFPITHQSITSELESITSTLGDDTSYLHAFRNVPRIVSPVESCEEL